MKFLIAGFGSIGRRHFQNLTALGEKDIIFFRSLRSTLPTDDLTGFIVETDLQSALNHKPDAVIISNPSSMHLDVAIPAAKAGCSIFMEKPVSDSLDGIDELRSALAQFGGRMLVGFQFRFHPGLQLIRELIEEKAIGKALSARVHWGEYLPGWHPWEDYRQGYAARADLGGGVVNTLCHPLDYLRWIMGEIDSLWSFSGHISDLELDVEDMAEIGLQFNSGALGSIHLNYIQRPGVHKMEVIGSAGTITWDNADGAVNIFRASTGLWEKYPAPENFERNTLFMNQSNHFIRVVKGDEEPSCTLEDGIKALRLTQAVHSCKDIKPVKL